MTVPPSFRRLVATAAVLALAGCATVGPPKSAQRKLCETLGARSVEITAPGGEAILPFIKTKSELPVVIATLDGQGPFRLLLDTGTSFSLLTQSVIKRLQLERSGPDFKDGDYTQHLYKLHRMTIGDVTFHRTLVTQDADNMLSRYSAGPGEPGFDGVIALEQFRDVLLTIDLRAGEARVRRGRLFSFSKNTIAAHTDSLHCDIEVTFDDGTHTHTSPFTLDTGANTGFQFPSEIEALPFQLRGDVPHPLMTYYGPVLYQASLLTGRARIAGIESESPMVELHQHGWKGPSDLGTMGIYAIGDARITIDRRHNLVQFEPPPEDTPDATWRRAGP